MSPTESLLMRAVGRAVARRIPVARRQRLGARIYDETALNPLGCVECGLPFVSGESDKEEACVLCAVHA